MKKYHLFACKTGEEFALKLQTDFGAGQHGVVLLQSSKPIRMNEISGIEKTLNAFIGLEKVQAEVGIISEVGCIQMQRGQG